MRIQEFLKEVYIDGVKDTDHEVIKSHPLQWIDTEVDIPIYKIKYKYTTPKNKEKEHIKFIIKQDLVDPEHYFMNWVEDYNNKHPFRALSNVEILDTEFIEGVQLILE